MLGSLFSFSSITTLRSGFLALSLSFPPPGSNYAAYDLPFGKILRDAAEGLVSFPFSSIRWNFSPSLFCFLLRNLRENLFLLRANIEVPS